MLSKANDDKARRTSPELEQKMENDRWSLRRPLCLHRLDGQRDVEEGVSSSLPGDWPCFVFDRLVLDDGIVLLRSFLSDGEKSIDVLVGERIWK